MTRRRRTDESFEEYRTNLVVEKKILKEKLKGTLGFNSARGYAVNVEINDVPMKISREEIRGLYDNNINPDFHVLFLQRSGSHMLVNALNSHPELDCSHCDMGHHGNGDLKGHAECAVRENVKKAIVLTRNHVDRVLSYQTTMADQINDSHTKKPLTVKRKRVESSNLYKKQKRKGEKFLERTKNIPEVLYIRYEDITGNKDVREIPEEWSYKICDFLGVKRMILKTEYHKPKVIGR